MNLSQLLFGHYRIWTAAPNRVALLNLCMQLDISYTGFVYHEDGAISFSLDVIRARRLLRAAKELGIELGILRSGGLPWLLWRYRKRAGLMLGSLLIVALLWLSQRVVWDIRVVGNTAMTESEVRDELRESGLTLGSYIPSIKVGQLENRVLLSSDRIAWLSINFDGTVAVVQIIEQTEAPPIEDLSKPANLIASCDAQIELVEIYRGSCVVSRGQAVKKGELLVSGVYDSATVGARYTRASGKILARTERVITVEVPLIYEEKSYQEKKYQQISLNFFDFSLNILKRTGNEDITCDIIKEEYGLDIFGLHALPVRWSVTHCLPYTLCSAERTYDQALQVAYAELSRQLSSMSQDAELLEKRIKTTFTESSLILECTVTCVEDIAVQSEFEITEQP